MALPRITASTVVKLVIASLCVGLVLAYFDTDPLDLLYLARDQITALLGDATSWIQWAIKYIFIGAVVVVPIWLVHYLWRAARGKP
jgi:hypothetical protein